MTQQDAPGRLKRDAVAGKLPCPGEHRAFMLPIFGHKDVATTTVYPHIANRGPAGVRSPADRLLAG
ncbi:MAG: hypothetical protein HY720_11380 [Planctomycetes bacterium]|nr:hypothetical protein [Planctomycetota bacterium]